MKRVAVGLIFTTFFIACGFAQTTDSLDYYDLTLEELSRISVYSTTRTSAQQALEAPATVIVIKSDQIEERGYKSLIDLLEDLPDFKVDRSVDPRWQNDVTVRGVRYMDKLIILLNGVRISSPTNEIIPIFENYPLNYAQQVEILYGPASALYGADAFSGVVNIVTRPAEEQAIVEASVWGAGLADAINGGANAFVSSQLGTNLHVTVSGQLYYDEQPSFEKHYKEEFQSLENGLLSGTFNTIFGPITPQTPVMPEIAYPLEAWSFFTGIQYKNLGVQFFRNHSHNPSTTANTPENNVYNKAQFFGHDVMMTTAKYFIEKTKWVSSSQLTYSLYRLDNQSNFRNVFTLMEPAYLYARSWKLKAEQLFTFDLGPKLKLTTGATVDQFYSIPRSNDLQDPVKNDHFREAIVANSIAPENPDGINAELVDTEFTNFGGLLQLARKTKHLDLTAGARIDKDTRFNATINPRLGVVFKPKRTFNIKALYGTAYLAPSPQNIYERYGSFITSDGGRTYESDFFNLPNPELRPQRISTSELGFKYFTNSGVSIGFNAFYSRVTNLISPISSVTHPEIVEALYPGNVYETDGFMIPISEIQINYNLGEANIYGGNVQIKFRWQGGNGWSGDLYLSESLIDGKLDIDEEGPAIARNLPGVAPSTFRIGHTIRNNDFSFHTRFTIVSQQRVFNVNGIRDLNNDSNFLNDNQYQELKGYQLLNMTLNYQFNEHVGISLIGRNMLNQKYRNVNIGASPESENLGGSAAIEFSNGAPQNPVRVQFAVNVNL